MHGGKAGRRALAEFNLRKKIVARNLATRDDCSPGTTNHEALMSFLDRFLKRGGKQSEKKADAAKGGAKDPKTSYRRYKPVLRKPKTLPPAPAVPPVPPAAPAASAGANGQRKRDKTRAVARRKKRRLLLLDDDVQLCEVLTSLFQWHGYEVTAVNRGVEGVQEIIKRDYDAIVCDFVMPVMRGDVFYIAVERVKPELCRRFVFITGNSDDSQVMLFLRSHGCPVLFKPLDTTALLGTIEAMIQKETA
jgi:CheY-like chemotaxis protein